MEEKLCPDGMVFNDYDKDVEKCDLPYNIDCSQRSKLRKCYLEVTMYDSFKSGIANKKNQFWNSNMMAWVQLSDAWKVGTHISGCDKYIFVMDASVFNVIFFLLKNVEFEQSYLEWN